jgi:hypothetical protein
MRIGSLQTIVNIIISATVDPMSPIETLVARLIQAQVAPPPVPSEPGEKERSKSDFEAFMRAHMRNLRLLPDDLSIIL